jgi:hypothetical protein
MKKILALAALFAISLLDAQAASHHGGHRGRPAMGGATCIRPQLSKMQPAHLATVTPGSEFSFVISNIDDPGLISVKVKQQAVDVKTEFKDPNYIVKGKIPASLHNTAARVDVKIDSAISSCRAEDGWLVKISEN